MPTSSLSFLAVIPFTATGPGMSGFAHNLAMGAFNGLSWSAFDMAAQGAGSSESLRFTFDAVDTNAGMGISGLDAIYIVDVFQGTGDHVQAVETAYDDAGNLLGTQTYVYGSSPAAGITFSSIQQSVHVTVTLTESIDSTGTDASVIDFSQIQMGLSEAPLPTASIGDIVFIDSAGTGLESGFDAGPGVPGVTVQLLDATGTTVLGTTVTDTRGMYSFTGLAAATYEVKFLPVNGYHFSPQGVGSNPGINSSANVVTGLTAPITLTAGQQDHLVEAGLVPNGSGVGGAGSLSILKTPSSTAIVPGGALSYSYTITNTGQTTLTNVSFTDVTNGDNSTSFTVTDPASLAPGATFTWTSPAATVPTTALAATGKTAPADSLIDAKLGAAAPSNFAVLSLGGTKSGAVAVNLNLTTVTGNVGIANTGTFSESSPSIVNGAVVVGKSVNASKAAGSNSGGIAVNDGLVTQAASDAFAAANYFAGLAPTMSASLFNNGNIGSGITVTGSAGLNVVDLSSLKFSGGNLVLNGPAGAEFVLNIAGNLTATSGSLVLGPNLTADDVILNITNPSASVSTSVPDTLNAILLAPYNKIVEDCGVFTGEVIGGYNQTITLMSGTLMKDPFAGSTSYGLTDVATVSAVDASGATLSAQTSAHVEVAPVGSGLNVAVNAPAAGANLGTTYGNAALLEFQFNPGTSVATKSQGTGTTIATATLGLPSGPSFILVSNSASDSPSAGTNYFEGLVSAGSNFYADATASLAGVANGGAFSTVANADLYMHVFASQAAFQAGQPAVQEIVYDSSGAHGMSLGDTIGSLKLVGYVAANGHGYVV